jgi:L-lactate dehydrogenase complex protein LldF
MRTSTDPLVGAEPFPTTARRELADTQLRSNLRHATHTIRDKRLRVVGELDDWERLRTAGAAIKAEVRRNLPELLLQFEAAAQAAGATVHWAADAAQACEIVAGLTRAAGADELVKVKSMATQEIGLNEALERGGIRPYETDLAELIVQLAGDTPSHILVPAIHYNRGQIRDIFQREMADAPAGLSDEPAELAEAARTHLRRRFLAAGVAVSGANFAIAETGSLVVVESEGNGRMCLTLPHTLISVVGVEKLLPTFGDLEVFLQLLPRSSTGERMNPYTSIWTGVTPGDGPQDVHIVLLDNGRAGVLADPVGRQALACIRCSACLNVCPVYERAGGHAYGSVYPGPIGAILSPQLTPGRNNSLPFASTLCGACYDPCPMKINIPEVLIHLRQQVPHPAGERAAMGVLGAVMRRPR